MALFDALLLEARIPQNRFTNSAEYAFAVCRLVAIITRKI
jgi:hypothetical protein